MSQHDNPSGTIRSVKLCRLLLLGKSDFDDTDSVVDISYLDISVDNVFILIVNMGIGLSRKYTISFKRRQGLKLGTD
jgi:hypothetical protein